MSLFVIRCSLAGNFCSISISSGFVIFSWRDLSSSSVACLFSVSSP